jgi:hypothetical protein
MILMPHLKMYFSRIITLYIIDMTTKNKNSYIWSCSINKRYSEWEIFLFEQMNNKDVNYEMNRVKCSFCFCSMNDFQTLAKFENLKLFFWYGNFFLIKHSTSLNIDEHKNLSWMLIKDI